MDDLPLTLLGTAAGILILSGWIQQIIKGYRTKSLKDLSKYLTILISAGAALWIVYGVVILDIYIILTNVAAVILMMTVLAMKLRYARLDKSDS